MATGKRASMREGPLAALFRKTTDDTSAPRPGAEGERDTGSDEDREVRRHALGAGEREADDHGAVEGEGEGREAVEGAGRETVAGETVAGAGRETVAGETVEGAGRAAVEREGEDQDRRAQASSPRADVPEPQHAGIPSPQERLRNAFSADIPINLLDRPGQPPVRDPVDMVPEPVQDVYARTDRTAEGFALPRAVGTPVLRVVGVGGAGVNAVNRMVEAEIEGIEFLAINTDLQSLQQSAAHETLHIGDAITRGLGSGSNPELGRQAAREEYDRLKALLRGSDMVFIAAGAGGGTGTGAAPIVAQIARELGALTVGIVTRPFQFEGTRRREQAEVGIAALAEEVDTLIVVPNNRLLSVLDRNTSMVEAFRVADDVLRQGVQGISDLVTLPGLINLDFADVRTIMSDAGNALLGIGMGSGERRAIDAAEQAVASPLLETSMEGAHSILLSITGGRDLSLWEVNESAKAVAEAAHPDANIIFGAMVDDKLADQVWVTVVATGYGDGGPRRRDRDQSRDRDRFGIRDHRDRREPDRVGDRDRGDRDRVGQRDRVGDRVGQRDRSAPGARGGSDRPASLREPTGDPRRAGSLREPTGEPRVSRVRRQTTEPLELDVPEFIPRR